MENRSKVAFFIPSFQPGGVEKALISVANELCLKGVAVQFLVASSKGEFKALLHPKIKYLSFDARVRSCTFKLRTYLRNNRGITLIAGPNYCNFVSILANYLSGKRSKIIVTHHNFQDVEMRGLGIRGLLNPFLIRMLYNRSHKVVAVSKGIKMHLMEDFCIQEEKIVQIPNPVIDEEFFSRAEAIVDGLEPLKKGRYLLSIGRLEKVKNYPVLLQVFRRVRDLKEFSDLQLVIVGEGKEKEALLNLSKTLLIDDSVYFVGALSNPLPFIKYCKIVCHTSLSESFGIVFIEAISLGKNIVTTSTTGALEVLEDTVGVEFVDVDNPDAFFYAVVRALKSGSKAMHFSLDRYSSSSVAEKYIELLCD